MDMELSMPTLTLRNIYHSFSPSERKSAIACATKNSTTTPTTVTTAVTGGKKITVYP